MTAEPPLCTTTGNSPAHISILVKTMTSTSSRYRSASARDADLHCRGDPRQPQPPQRPHHLSTTTKHRTCPVNHCSDTHGTVSSHAQSRVAKRLKQVREMLAIRGRIPVNAAVFMVHAYTTEG